MITLRAPQRTDRRTEADEATRPTLRVVDPELEPARGRRSAGGVVGALLVALLFVCIFGVVVFQVFLVQTQSRLDSLDNQLTTQDQRAKQLRLDTADLESPDRILNDGQALGMIPPPAIAFLKPKPDDDTKAQFDPSKEKAPVTTPTTSANQAAGSASSATTPTTAWKPASGGTTSSAAKGSTTPSTSKATTSTTKPTTPTTTKSTTPTTTKSTTSPPTTTKRTTPTTTATTTR